MSVNFNPDEKKRLASQESSSSIQVNQTDNLDDSCFSVDAQNFEETEKSGNIDLVDFEISDELSEVEAQKNSKVLFFGNEGYTFKTNSGVEITVENPDDLGDIQVFENKETGEVFVVNANGAKITSSNENTNISIYNSKIQSINTKKGNDTINVYGSTIDNLNTGSGSDFVNIDDSSVDKVKTSKDFLWGLFGSSSNSVNINNSDIEKLETGYGNDTVVLSDSEVESLKTKGGVDSISSNNTEIAKDDLAKKDLKVEDGNYLDDFDVSKMPQVESDEVITLESGETVNVSDYISLISQQEVGFETQEEYQQYAIQAISDNLESMKEIFQAQNDSDGVIANGFDALKELSNIGISSEDVNEVIAEQEEIINNLTQAMNGESEMSFEEAYEKYTGSEFSTEKIDKYIELSNIASAVNSGCYYDKDYADKLEEATGKSVDEINQEFALCQNEVLGKSQALQNLVEDYSASQEGFADKLSSIISTSGMVCIAVGAVVSFIPGGAAIGVPLMAVGKNVALGGMLVDNAIDLVDYSTDKDGLTGDEVKNLALETGVELVSYGTGRAIGYGTNTLNSLVSSKAAEAGISKAGSYVLGQSAETLADTALSLIADYTITQGQSLITTGELMDGDDYWSSDRFLGEGQNQLMGILTGLSSAKINAYSKDIAQNDADLKSQTNDVLKTGTNSNNGKPLQMDLQKFAQKATDGNDTLTLVKNNIEMSGNNFEFSESDYNDIAKAVDYTTNRLNSSGINATTQDVLNLAQKFNYSTSSITDLISINAMNGGFGRAVILSKLIDDGLIDYDTLDSIYNGITKAGNFNLAYKDSFDDVLKSSDLSDAVETCNKLAQGITEGKISPKNSDAILNNISSLTANDIDFIKENMSSNKFYKGEDYIDTFLYFKNLKTNDGTGVLNMDELCQKIDKYGMGDTAASVDTNAILYKNIKALMDINPSSVDSSYTTMLLDLIQSGEVNASALRSLKDVSDLKSITATLFDADDPNPIASSDKWNFSPNLKSDIDKMCDTIASNKNKANLQQELLDTFIPDVANNASGIEKVNIGDAYKVDGEDGIRIKISDTESKKINISKETYYKLFPPVERYASAQQVLGDCYCIENMMLLYSIPDQRANLLEMFSEDESGNVKIKFPKNDFEVVFKNGEFSEDKQADLYSSGADGFKMLEYAYGRTLVENEIQKAVENLSGDELAKFCEFTEQNQDNTFVYQDENGKTSYMKYSDAFEEKTELITEFLNKKNSYNMFNTPYPTFTSTLLGSGGTQVTVLNKLGYNSSLYFPKSKLPSDSEIDTQIEQIKNNPNMNESVKNDAIEMLKYMKKMSPKEKEIYMSQIKEQEEQVCKIYESQGVSKEQMKTLDDNLIANLKNPDFYKENIVQFAIGAHAYGFTCETDSNGNTVYYLYNPHHQGVPIEITNLEAFFNKNDLLQFAVIAEKE